MARLRLRWPGRQGELGVPGGVLPSSVGSYDAERFGRLVEGVARFLGTSRYLAAQTVLVVAWIVLNTIAVFHRWDPYPFILLNLVFSTQAAYAAPLILQAQNRQDDRDRASIERDRDVAARTQADTAFLIREIATIRLALADAVTTDDLDQGMTSLENQVTGT